MTPISYWMAIYASPDILVRHLLQRRPQDVIPSHPNIHLLTHNILHPVSFPQAIHQTSRNVLFRLARAQYIADVLCICIHAQRSDAKVDVDSITVLNDAALHARDVPWRVFGVFVLRGQDGDGGVEPGCVVLLLDLLAEPPADVLQSSLVPYSGVGGP